MKKKSKSSFVLEVYPKARIVKINNYTEIWSDNTYLGKGKSNKQAWASAYNNNINI